MAEAIVSALAVYITLGLLFAVPFLVWGVQRLDAAAGRSGLAFRLIIGPGVAALWPVLLGLLVLRR